VSAKETRQEYADRQREADLEPTARAERAKGLVPEWIFEGFGVAGLVKRVEQLDKEDSEQRNALRRVSDLEWELT
jgi:hypothetical protein